jgi:hypothetical protein
VEAKGYAITAVGPFMTAAQAALSVEMYSCYAKASTELKYRGASLAESAPVHVLEVAELVKDYWRDKYWPAHRGSVADSLIKRLKLKAGAPGK